jgi:hypothetical protein
MNSQSWEMLTMAFKSKKKWSNSEIQSVEMVKMGCKLKIYQSEKFKCVENGEDALQTEN